MTSRKGLPEKQCNLPQRNFCHAMVLVFSDRHRKAVSNPEEEMRASL